MSGSGSSPYVPNPDDPTQPVVTVNARTAAAEFRAIKTKLNNLASLPYGLQLDDHGNPITITGGGLVATLTDPINTKTTGARSSVGKPIGTAWYFEVTVNSAVGNVEVGLATIDEKIYDNSDPDIIIDYHLGTTIRSMGYRSNGDIWEGNANHPNPVSAYTAGDVIGISFTTNNLVTFFKNGVHVGDLPWNSTIASIPKYPVVMLTTYNDQVVCNFGATPFKYSAAGSIPFVTTTPTSYGVQNLLRNGEFQVDQRHDHAETTLLGGDYPADGWKYLNNNTGTAPDATTRSIELDYNTAAITGGHTHVLSFNLRAPAVLDAGDWYGVGQGIETSDVGSRLQYGTPGARVATLLFTFASSEVGIFTAGVYSKAFDRNFTFNFTYPTAGIYTRYAIIIPGDTEALSAWTNSGAPAFLGMRVIFMLGAGANFAQIPAESAWTNGSTPFQHPQGVNWVTTPVPGLDFPYIQITGVEFKLGYYDVNSPRELIPIAMQYQMCYRYFYKTTVYTGFISQFVGSFINDTIQFPVAMRFVGAMGWQDLSSTGAVVPPYLQILSNNSLVKSTTSTVPINESVSSVGNLTINCDID